jgi:DUF2075 family protein
VVCIRVKEFPNTIDDIMKTIDDKINEDVPAAKTAISRKDDKLGARRNRQEKTTRPRKGWHPARTAEGPRRRKT